MPADATNKTVTWSISSGTDKASISPTGLVTALADGTATARATANDGSGVYGSLSITISNQIIRVTGISVTGEGGRSAISIDDGTLQLSAVVTPSNATNKTVTWSISSGTDKARISSSGLVSALDNGTATLKATANDGSGVYGTLSNYNLKSVKSGYGHNHHRTGGASAIEY
ncbi:MAG: Ig-like domain-containing protein [Bacteroidales bacterium]|nr:Ig-like domain-containing protein [Bacteroidales bacterium]